MDSDPLFTDVLSFDYTLTAQSPCIGAGIPMYIYNGDTLLALTEGYGPVDLGAFQVEPSVQAAQQPASPSHLILHANYPNPFNPITRIKFELPADGNICMRIYDIRGRQVRELLNRLSQIPGADMWPEYLTSDFTSTRVPADVY